MEKIKSEIDQILHSALNIGDDGNWFTPYPSKDAPDWANYRTIDYDGTVSFWEEKPFIEGTIWNAEIGKLKNISSDFNWKETLQQRPR